jgi:hypothetical protein
MVEQLAIVPVLDRTTCRAMLSRVSRRRMVADDVAPDESLVDLPIETSVAADRRHRTDDC